LLIEQAKIALGEGNHPLGPEEGMNLFYKRIGCAETEPVHLIRKALMVDSRTAADNRYGKSVHPRCKAARRSSPYSQSFTQPIKKAQDGYQAIPSQGWLKSGSK
jgi:hypothetical protein